MPLTDTQIRNAKPAAKSYRLTDAEGLQLEVRSTGAKFWRFRYRIDGKENMFAAGEYAAAPRGETPEQAAERVAAGRMSLAEARLKLNECGQVPTVSVGALVCASAPKAGQAVRLFARYFFARIMERQRVKPDPDIASLTTQTLGLRRRWVVRGTRSTCCSVS